MKKFKITVNDEVFIVECDYVYVSSIGALICSKFVGERDRIEEQYGFRIWDMFIMMEDENKPENESDKLLNELSQKLEKSMIENWELNKEIAKLSAAKHL